MAEKSANWSKSRLRLIAATSIDWRAELCLDRCGRARFGRCRRRGANATQEPAQGLGLSRRLAFYDCMKEWKQRKKCAQKKGGGRPMVRASRSKFGFSPMISKRLTCGSLRTLQEKAGRKDCGGFFA
jgi:hypothetical protein